MLLQLPSRVLEVELTLASSNYHTEMNPSDVGNNDRYVVQEILKVRSCKALHTRRSVHIACMCHSLTAHDAKVTDCSMYLQSML